MSSSSEGLSDLIRRSLSEYPVEQIGEGLTSHVAREAIEHRIPKEIEAILNDEDIVVQSSAGQGRWTSIPWAAIMDPRETTQIQEGVYVVYLFEPQEERVSLTLNQGVTKLKDEVGSRKARQHLKNTAREVRKEIQPEDFTAGSLEFPHASNRNKLYGPGTIFYKQYSVGEIPDDEVLARDLRTLVASYQAFVSGKSQDQSPPSVYQAPIPIESGPIRSNYRRTVMEGVPREELENVCEIPVQHETVRVWGNREDEPAEEGDYLLFGERDGRYDGEYSVVARITHATVLDPATAERFTDAVGWGEETDATFPHVMFLDPVYRVDLDREWFWDLLGFKGWPNDTYSAVDFDREGSKFDTEYQSVAEFVEDIEGEQLYPKEKDAPEVDPAGEYGSIDEIITTTAPYYWVNQSNNLEEIEEGYLQAPRTDFPNYDLQKLEEGDIVFNYSNGEVIGYSEVTQPAYIVEDEGEEKRRVDVEVYHFPSPLSFAEIFPYLWREDVRLEKYYPINQAGVNQQYLFNLSEKAGEYLLEQGLQKGDISHPLLTRLDDQDGTRPVCRVTAPPDYWLTAFQYGSIGIADEKWDRWEDVQPGDIVLFHSRATPANEDLSEQPNGLIGAGIIGGSTRKDDQWWHDEQTGDVSLPNLVSLDRMYVTGSVEGIDISTPTHEKSQATLERELGKLTSGLLPFSKATEICENTTGREFPRQQEFVTFRTADGEIDTDRPRALLKAMADRLTEVTTINAHTEFTGTVPDKPLSDLYFPGDQQAELVDQISSALQAGKHIILTGPPGTGKTEIARKVCQYLAEEYPYLYSDFQMTTATADWSTFDTVGGYMPNGDPEDGESLAFNPGIVLNRLKDSNSGCQVNEPLIIDELNRADIDKAFGQLFTLLSGQSVQLPYTDEGEEIELCNADQVATPPADHQYVVPESWRIFATMNTYDKTSLYEMSYAFMRRFAFIRVGAPDLPGEDNEDDLLDLMGEYTDVWNLDANRETLLAVGHVWRETNTAVDERAIGPAIVKDILGHVTIENGRSLGDRLTQAVISYVFPQLEGVPHREQIVRQITTVDEIDEDELDTAAHDMLQVSVTGDE